MIKTFRNHTPVVPDSAFVSETALIMGEVTLGERCGVWPGAVIRGDFAHIHIGTGTIIEDNVVVHTGREMDVGENVIVGHGAVLHERSHRPQFQHDPGDEVVVHHAPVHRVVVVVDVQPEITDLEVRW